MNLVITNNGLQCEREYFKTFFQSDQTIYEVIRVINGVAIFLEDHFSRLNRSVQIQHSSFAMSFTDFRGHIAELVGQNRQDEGNVKFSYSVVKGAAQWAFQFIPHSYPSPDDYKQGVSVDLFLAERQNPNAKVVQQAIRDEANRMIADRKLYEVLLVNRDGIITEGSRSNVFFVKSNVVYTAPAAMVLVGITRQKVIDCLNELGLQLVEQAVAKDETGSFDAAFLTGTSPKVLPIRSVGATVFDVQNKAVFRLMDAYNAIIQRYIMNDLDSGKL